jgi:hypothetical protein
MRQSSSDMTSPVAESYPANDARRAAIDKRCTRGLLLNASRGYRALRKPPRDVSGGEVKPTSQPTEIVMTMGLMYWILMLLWFVFSLVWTFGGGAIGQYGPAVNSVLLFILFLLLGWKVFGQPIS